MMQAAVRARRGRGAGAVESGSKRSGWGTGDEEAEDLDGPHLLEVAVAEEVRDVCLQGRGERCEVKRYSCGSAQLEDYAFGTCGSYCVDDSGEHQRVGSHEECDAGHDAGDLCGSRCLEQPKRNVSSNRERSNQACQ